MIYCREKLIDVLLEAPWVQLEERFDFEISVKKCIDKGLFSNQEWASTDLFLAGIGNYSEPVYKVICTLAHELGYQDEKFLNGKDQVAEAYYRALDKGVRL